MGHPGVYGGFMSMWVMGAYCPLGYFHTYGAGVNEEA